LWCAADAPGWVARGTGTTLQTWGWMTGHAGSIRSGLPGIITISYHFCKGRRLMSRCMLTAVAVVGALSAPIAWAAGAPPAGVYSCYDARMGYGVPGCIRTSMGCTGLVITPMPVVMFGLIDGSTYSDYDGHHGHYKYDAAAGVITMTDGSRQGWRYRKSAEWSFGLIDNTTGKELYTCPLETAKNPNRGPW